MSLKRNIKILTYFSLFQNISFYAPIAILYFQHVTSSYALAASIFSLTLISAAIFEVPTGIFSDWIGRKQTIILGALSMTLAVVAYALALNYWILVIGAILEGLSRSFYSGNNNAFLHNILKQENLENDYHHYFGKLSGIFAIGASGAALLSGFIANWSFTLLMWLSVVPQAICLILAMRLVDVPIEHTTHNPIRHLKEALVTIRNSFNLKLLSISDILLTAFGSTAYEFQAAVYRSLWPLWAVGVARAISEWVSIPTHYYSGKIVDKFGEYKTMVWSNFICWLGNVVATVFPSIGSPLVISLVATAWGPGDTAAQSLLQKEFTERQRATIASLNSFVSSILFATFALLIGKIADFKGPIFALFVVQIFILPTIILQWILMRKNKKA